MSSGLEVEFEDVLPVTDLNWEDPAQRRAAREAAREREISERSHSLGAPLVEDQASSLFSARVDPADEVPLALEGVNPSGDWMPFDVDENLPPIEAEWEPWTTETRDLVPVSSPFEPGSTRSRVVAEGDVFTQEEWEQMQAETGAQEGEVNYKVIGELLAAVFVLDAERRAAQAAAYQKAQEAELLRQSVYSTLQAPRVNQEPSKPKEKTPLEKAWEGIQKEKQNSNRYGMSDELIKAIAAQSHYDLLAHERSHYGWHHSQPTSDQKAYWAARLTADNWGKKVQELKRGDERSLPPELQSAIGRYRQAKADSGGFAEPTVSDEQFQRVLEEQRKREKKKTKFRWR